MKNFIKHQDFMKRNINWKNICDKTFIQTEIFWILYVVFECKNIAPVRYNIDELNVEILIKRF